MKSIARCLASAMVSLSTIHTASGLPLDSQRDEPLPFPTIRTEVGGAPLSALLKPAREALTTRGTEMFPPSIMPPRDTPVGVSLLSLGSTDPSPYFAPPVRFNALSLPPDIDLRDRSHNPNFDDSTVNLFRAGFGETPEPITIAEPRSASLLAIGLAGLGLRACWGARRRDR